MSGLSRVKVPVGDEGVGELGPLLVGAGAPVDAVRGGQRGDLVDEVEDALVGGRAVRRCWLRRSGLRVVWRHVRAVIPCVAWRRRGDVGIGTARCRRLVSVPIGRRRDAR